MMRFVVGRRVGLEKGMSRGGGRVLCVQKIGRGGYSIFQVLIRII